MSTKNYDSSLLTKKRESKSLATYATALQTQIDSANGQFVVRRTQPNNPRYVYFIEQNLGKCYCVQDISGNYGFNPSGGQCGCGLGPS